MNDLDVDERLKMYMQKRKNRDFTNECTLLVQDKAGLLGELD